MVYYFGRNCQNEHWPQHSGVCREIKKVYDVLKDGYLRNETWFLAGSTAAIALHLRFLIQRKEVRIFPGCARSQWRLGAPPMASDKAGKSWRNWENDRPRPKNQGRATLQEAVCHREGGN